MEAHQTLPASGRVPAPLPACFLAINKGGRMVGSASDLSLTAMCEPVPAFRPSPCRVRHFLQPRVSRYIMAKKKELPATACTSENAPVSDGRKLLPARPVCGCCSLGQAQCLWLPVADSLGWLAGDLTNPTSSSLPLWPWVAPGTS